MVSKRIMVSQPMSGVPDDLVRKRNKDAIFNICFIKLFDICKNWVGVIDDFPDDFDAMVVGAAKTKRIKEITHYEEIDIVTTIDATPPEDSPCGRLWYLGNAIQCMGLVDEVYFHWCYPIAKGCLCERYIADQYNVPTMLADRILSEEFKPVFERYPRLREIINDQIKITLP